LAVAAASDELVTDTIAIGETSDIEKAVDRFYRAGCTRVLLASSPFTKEHISQLLRELSPLRGSA
ncbi:MAG TPA: hypothetical protein VNF07_04970, partial [Acidimicrobiales bacterium]|nr:hypothetical protein [Acidimicrobiales bacterium]